MRLFIAVLFDRNTKEALYHIVEELRRIAGKGSFTELDNLHLTLNFIGETKRLQEVQAAMHSAVERTKTGKLSLSLKGIGRFKRAEGDIYWIGVERNDMLWRLQKELAKELREAGFYELDDREYKPHLTLGRKIKNSQALEGSILESGMKPLLIEVQRISLMKSERIEGRLTYTEIDQVGLK